MSNNVVDTNTYELTGDERTQIINYLAKQPAGQVFNILSVLVNKKPVTLTVPSSEIKEPTI